MAKISFLTETLDMLSKCNKTDKDVLFVRTARNQCTFAEFKEMIKDFYYNDGYGCEEINLSLKIVGNGWWLERGSYDGAEWWEFKRQPSRGWNTGKLDFKSRDEYRD